MSSRMGVLARKSLATIWLHVLKSSRTMSIGGSPSTLSVSRLVSNNHITGFPSSGWQLGSTDCATKQNLVGFGLVASLICTTFALISPSDDSVTTICELSSASKAEHTIGETSFNGKREITSQQYQRIQVTRDSINRHRKKFSDVIRDYFRNERILLRTRCEEKVFSNDTDALMPLIINDDDDIIEWIEHDNSIEISDEYLESVRFFQCLEYHRSLLHDYHRRWFVPKQPRRRRRHSNPMYSGSETKSTASTNDADDTVLHTTIKTNGHKKNDVLINSSAVWPKDIPTANEIAAIENDLEFCRRGAVEDVSLSSQCNDQEFRVAVYYLTAAAATAATTSNGAVDRQLKSSASCDSKVASPQDQKQLHYVKHIKRLAEMGHADAMCFYGMLLNKGLGNVLDAKPHQSMIWWQRAVNDHRHIQATFELATSYYLGEGAAENLDDSVHLFSRAAHLGHAGAAYMLGVMLLDGVGIVRDRSDALDWLVTAAELGHDLAQHRVIAVLSEDYNDLDAGVSSEMSEAVKVGEATNWVNLQDEAKQQKIEVNIERRHTIGGGSKNPVVLERRQTKVLESRDPSSS